MSASTSFLGGGQCRRAAAFAACQVQPLCAYLHARARVCVWGGGGRGSWGKCTITIHRPNAAAKIGPTSCVFMYKQ